MELHNGIMAIRPDATRRRSNDPHQAYLEGHGDARQAAAMHALAGDKLARALREIAARSAQDIAADPGWVARYARIALTEAGFPATG